MIDDKEYQAIMGKAEPKAPAAAPPTPTAAPAAQPTIGWTPEQGAAWRQKYLSPEALKSFAVGVPVGVASVPGELEKLLMSISPKGMMAPGAKTFFPTASEIESQIPESLRPKSEIGKTTQEVGELAGGLAWPTGKAGAAVSAIEQIGKRILPGALKRATMIERIAKPPPEGMNTVGKVIREKLLASKESALASRAAATEPKVAAYMAQPEQIETKVATEYRQHLMQELQKKLHPSEQAIIQGSLDNLSREGIVNPGMRVIDLERRQLGDIAEGRMEGFDAAKKQVASKLQAKLESIIKSNVKEFEPYIGGYRESSKTVNLFNTAFGKAATGKAGEFVEDFAKTDPVLLPNRAFRSKESIAAFRELAKDDKFVDEVARSYVATRLNQTIGPYLGGTLQDYNQAAKSARRWLINERSTRGITALPEIDAETEKFVQGLEKTVKTQERARTLGKGAAYATGAGLGLGGLYFGGRHVLEGH